MVNLWYALLVHSAHLRALCSCPAGLRHAFVSDDLRLPEL